LKVASGDRQAKEAREVSGSREAHRVGIIGLGYVGLPIAVAFADAGFSVIGIETDPAKTTALRNNDSYIECVSNDRLRTLTYSGRLQFTEDYAALRVANTVIVCLPTPLNKHQEPDVSALVSGTQAIARNLRVGALVVLESTSYPGTTREVVLPILEGAGNRGNGASQQSVWQVGRDFYLAFSPERIDPANPHYKVHNIPKIVSGVTPECSRRAVELYGAIIDKVHRVSTPEIAETAKLLENVFRAVNIALVNELAVLCHSMGVDVWEVIEAAKTKPFGFMPFYPGPGTGGHCIPVDPLYLSWRAQSFQASTALIEHACTINTKMSYHVAARILEALDTDGRSIVGSRVLLVGISYKPNIGDLRESPSLALLGLLSEYGVEVAYHDPYIPYLPDVGLSSTELTAREVRKADCVVIATDHDLADLETVVVHASKVIDLRNAIRRRLEKLPDNVEVL
jgi:UDP-N-acetyl-D-glucosamine dehydrogenase